MWPPNLRTVVAPLATPHSRSKFPVYIPTSNEKDRTRLKLAEYGASEKQPVVIIKSYSHHFTTAHIIVASRQGLDTLYSKGRAIVMPEGNF
jgi:hypothetical protein